MLYLSPYLLQTLQKQSKLKKTCNFIEMNLRSSPVFAFLLLHEKLCLFHPCLYKFMSTLGRLLHIDKNFFVHDESDISKQGCTSFQIFFGKLLSGMRQFGWRGYEHTKMRKKKKVLFHREEKTDKRGRKRVLCKSIFSCSTSNPILIRAFWWRLCAFEDWFVQLR